MTPPAGVELAAVRRVVASLDVVFVWLDGSADRSELGWEEAEARIVVEDRERVSK